MDKTEVMRLIEHGQGTYTLFPNQHAELFDILANEPTLHKDGIILELGVAFGRTSILLAYLAKHKQMQYHGIDLFILCEEKDFRTAIDATGLPYNLHVGFTTSEPWYMRPNDKEVPWDKPINFLFVDACHDDPWFSADCRKFLPLVEPGCLVAFDDWDTDPTSPHYTVSKQGEIFTAGWEDLGYIDGRVKVKRKPK